MRTSKLTIVILILFFCNALTLWAQDAEEDINDYRFETVKDTKTGLIWQKCAFGQNYISCAGTPASTSWRSAMGHCKKLNEQSATTGISTWRLPNINELKSILDRTKKNPSIDAGKFPNTSMVSGYWTSTTNKANFAQAWSLNFSTGEQITKIKDEGSVATHQHIRCVAGT